MPVATPPRHSPPLNWSAFEAQMRDRRRISKVADMARVLDVDPGTLFRIRRGSSVPKLDLLIKMAEVAGMSLDVLVGRRPAPRQRKAGM